MPSINRYSIDKLQSVNITSIAKDLGLTINRNNKCLCPFHADKSPSLKLWPQVNGWKCYGCGEKGTNIDLVMKKLGIEFVEACEWIANQYGIMLCYDDGKPLPPSIKPKTITTQKPLPTMYLNQEKITQFLDNGLSNLHSSFCRSIVSSGILSEEQISHAAEVYRLGITADEGVIFWQIDTEGRIHDGKIMFYCDDCHRDHARNPSWVSYRMKKKCMIPQEWKASYCLFGLHLLSEHDNPIVAVVESEKTAVICSELLPYLTDRRVIWMATAGQSFLTIDALRPLINHEVVIFPDTDPTGQTYTQWELIVNTASQELNHSFYISPLLEKHATAEQKARKIDIADFILEKHCL